MQLREKHCALLTASCTIFIGELYASNARWIACSEEALQRLLNRLDQVKSATAVLSTKSGNVLDPRSTTPSKPNSWYDEKNQNSSIVAPSIFYIEQTMVNPVPIYGHVTQAMALEDNMMDIELSIKCTLSARQESLTPFWKAKCVPGQRNTLEDVEVHN
jgi:hypothetical protein